MSPNWGSVAEWVAALGTLAAFGALAIAVSEWRSSRSNQARLIVPQPARESDDPDAAWLADDDIVLVNQSDRPVFDVHIGVHEKVADDLIVWESLRVNNVQAPARRAILRPGKSTGNLTIVGTIEGTLEAANPRRDYLAFSFTDANGRRWHRVGIQAPIRRYE